jgi:hypothetical protein
MKKNKKKPNLGQKLNDYLDELLNELTEKQKSDKAMFDGLALVHAVLCAKVGQLESVMQSETDVTEMVWNRSANIVSGYMSGVTARRNELNSQPQQELKVKITVCKFGKKEKKKKRKS